MHVKVMKDAPPSYIFTDNFRLMNAISISITSIQRIIYGYCVAAYFEASVSVQQTFNRRRIEANKEKEETKDRENRSSFRS